jgi:putative acetyltransferase
MNIRQATTIQPENFDDYDAITEVNRLAFSQDAEAKLITALRRGGYSCVSLVAEIDEKIVGHILFSRLPIHTGNGSVARHWWVGGIQRTGAETRTRAC